VADWLLNSLGEVSPQPPKAIPKTVTTMAVWKSKYITEPYMLAVQQLRQLCDIRRCPKAAEPFTFGSSERPHAGNCFQQGFF
jgi:hypothetical protein